MRHRFPLSVPAPDGALDVEPEAARLLAALADELFPPRGPSAVSYKEALTLAISCAARRDADVWDVLIASTGLRPQDNPLSDDIVAGATAYYLDQLSGALHHRLPSAAERLRLSDLARAARRAEADPRRSPTGRVEDDPRLPGLTAEVYEIGKAHCWSRDLRAGIEGLSDEDGSPAAKALRKEGQALLRSFFAGSYAVVLGQEDGPRLPNFILMRGAGAFAEFLENTVDCVGNGWI